MPGSVTVVVVNYGSSALLASNLVMVHAAIPDARVIVVDNPTTDGELARARELAARHGWTVLSPATNLGFGGGVNLAATAAFADGATEILVLNPDARIDAASVDALREAVADDRMTLVSPIVLDESGRTWFAGLDLALGSGSIRSPRRRADHPDDEVVEWLSGACLLITHEVWSAAGGFDDDYFLYWEDVDFSRRVTDAGGRVRVIRDATAVHDEGATHRSAAQRAEAKSETYYYYNIRNRMLYAARHLDGEGIRRWSRTSTAAAWAVLLRGGRRQFLRPVRPVRAAVRALRDGRRIARAALERQPIVAGQYTPSTTSRKVAP